MKKKCTMCAKDISFALEDAEPIYGLDLNKLNIVCDKCKETSDENVKNMIRCAFQHEREQAWLKICPPIYQESNLEQMPDMKAYNDTMKWSYNSRGLILRGKTGSGKTRTAWMLVKREWMTGRKIECFGAKELSRECVKVATESAIYAKRWTKHMGEVDILFIDDFGKSDMSEFVKATLFELIENRISNLKPLILTTNDTGETLVKRFSSEQGEPIVRRLREYCDSIVFKLPQKI